jgi:NAD(P)-dependent dehydrogenase (short-subunit alcohol dehydrogenase family)
VLLRDKVAIVAGVSSLRGIGYATAELFAQHGAKVVAVDRAMDEGVAGAVRNAIAAAAPGAPEVICLPCDISSYADCQEVVRAAIARHRVIDSLVNCAGIVRAQGMLEIEEADLQRMLDVNLKGAFNLSKAALEVFTAQKEGVIVNVASVAAQRGGGLVGGAHYAASKGGVISLTRTIAREFGPLGVRANVVCPSMTDTSMLDGNVTSEQYDQIVGAIPLRRAGKAVDMAGACLFLASDLSAYVTGATIDVNGGSHIH